MSNKIIIDKESDYIEAINYSFSDKEIVFLSKEEKMKNIEKLGKSISKNDNVIFFNLNNSNILLLNTLSYDINKTVIFQYSISELSDINIYNELLLIIKLLSSNSIKNVYCLDFSLYLIFKDKYNFKYLQLNTKKFENESGKSVIGIIAHPGDYYAGIMNEVSAITLTDCKEIKIFKPEKPVKSFCRRFGIKIKKTRSLSEAISNNEINLYVNFCNISYALILESMDKGIPCIVGNTNFFDNNKYLKEQLVLRSDDSIDEIRDKIDKVKKNKSKILEEYAKFRNDYSIVSKKSIENFMLDIN